MNKRVNINFYLSKLSIKRTKYNSMKMIYWKKKSVNANSHCFVLFSTYLNSAAVLGRPNTRASWRWGNTEYSRPLSRGSRIPLIPLLLQLLLDWNLRDKVFPQCLAVHVCFFFQCAHIVTVYDMVSSSYRFATPKPSSVARRALPGALSFQGCMNLQDWGKL